MSRVFPKEGLLIMINTEHPLVVARPSRSRKIAEKIVRRVVLLLAVIVVAEIAFHLFISPYLRVRQIIIRGDQPTSDEQLMSLVEIDTNTHYGQVKPAKIEQRLAQLPAIAQVEVTKRFPNTVIINIQQRQPVGIIFRDIYADPQLLFFDPKGVIFSAQLAIPPDSLPVISGLSDDEWSVGTDLAIQLRELLQSIAKLRDHAPDLYRSLSEVVVLPLANHHYEALLYFDALHIPVRIANSISRYQLKEIAVVLDVLAQQPDHLPISEIDFRSGTAVLSFAHG